MEVTPGTVSFISNPGDIPELISSGGVLQDNLTGIGKAVTVVETRKGTDKEVQQVM